MNFPPSSIPAMICALTALIISSGRTLDSGQLGAKTFLQDLQAVGFPIFLGYAAQKSKKEIEYSPAFSFSIFFFFLSISISISILPSLGDMPGVCSGMGLLGHLADAPALP